MSTATNLTSAPTPLVGRMQPVAQVRKLISGGTRLVSLLGPGGVGKTRLALRVAELEHGAGIWPGGVWLCELAETRTLEAVCGAVAHVVGATLDAEDPVESVARRLRAVGATLVVLDNCEQIVSVLGSALARWQRLVPETRWLVTSRERIRVAGEHVYELPPMSLPDGVDDAAASEAVQLFIERAASVRTGYEPDAEELAQISELVRRLDGLPLAIELAAARAGLLSTASLLERVASRFALLSSGPRDVEVRHQTLRAAIDGSWELLTTEEQRVLRQCAVFRGGFTLEAAEQVVLVDREATLRIIEALHDKSLLRVRAASPTERTMRLGFYESIRDYALEQLEVAGETEATLVRHGRHFAGWGFERAWAERYHGSREAGTDLIADLHNLLLAHDRALTAASNAPAAIDDALRLAFALYRPIATRHTLTSFLALVGATLDHRAAASADRGLLAITYAVRGMVRPQLGPLDLAVADFETALAHAERSGDAFVEAAVLMHRVQAYADTGRNGEAREGAVRAQRTFEAQGLALLAGQTRLVLAHIAVRANDLDAAYADCAAAADVYRVEGGAAILGYALGYLGTIQHLRGHLAEAQQKYAEALPMAESVGNRAQFGVYRGFSAMLALERGEHDLARAELDHAIATLRDLGEVAVRMCFVAVAGALAATRGAIEEAEERLEEAAGRLHAIGGAPLATAELMRGFVDLARARQARSDGDFSVAAALRARAEARLREAAGAPQQNEELLVARRLMIAELARDAESASAPQTTESSFGDALLVHYKGDWFELPGGQRVVCRAKPVVRALLAILAERRARAAGEPVEIDTLVRAAWPGQRLDHKTAQHRLHNALGILRELGLRDQLIAAGRGYLLDPAMPVRVVGA